MIIKIILLAIALGGFACGFYCQTKARRCISKEKILNLKDTSVIARGPMPPNEILNDEGQKYYKGFCIGIAVFVGSIIVLLITTKLLGN